MTIVRDRETRESKGVAFVLFVRVEDAVKAVQEMDQKNLNGFTLKCSIAKDNGRAKEFIKKKLYPKNNKCYECGASSMILNYTDLSRNRVTSAINALKIRLAKEKNRKM